MADIAGLEAALEHQSLDAQPPSVHRAPRHRLIADRDECQAEVHRLIDAGHPVAVDLEGHDLCRNGRLAIVQLAVEDPACPVLLIDIVALGKDAFGHGGLRQLLENDAQHKIMYDPRTDAGALFHLHQTRLAGVVDVQVLLVRFENRRNNRFLKGLSKAFDSYPKLSESERQAITAMKQRGIALFDPRHGGSYAVWFERPLSSDMAEYAAGDVRHLHGMARYWSRGSPANIARVIEAADERIRKQIGLASYTPGKHMARIDFAVP